MIKTIEDIPSTFMIGGEKIKVEWSDTLHTELDCWGICEYRTNTITLQSTSGNDRNDDAIVQTFLHELFHMVLYKIGHEDTYQCEQFVDLLATFIHQFAITSEK